ncbi:MAG: hypothetical protein LH654_10755 [Thermoleophilia bacterium]|nr:hypothetical protein [Thermoleophilia bacterium]
MARRWSVALQAEAGVDLELGGAGSVEVLVSGSFLGTDLGFDSVELMELRLVRVPPCGVAVSRV